MILCKIKDYFGATSLIRKVKNSFMRYIDMKTQTDLASVADLISIFYLFWNLQFYTSKLYMLNYVKTSG